MNKKSAARKAPDYVVSHIKKIEERLRALADSEDQSRCTVDPEVKEKVRLYIESHITPHVSMLSDWAVGKEIPSWWKRGAS